MIKKESGVIIAKKRAKEAAKRGDCLIQTLLPLPLATWLRARATEEGITTSAYVRRMVLNERRYKGDGVCQVHDPLDVVPGRICGEPLPCKEHSHA